MRATYFRGGKPFAVYNLCGESENAELLRLMAWSTACAGWDWRVD